MARIVLASKSPRRQELLHRMGIDEFTILVPEADESYPEGLSPEEVVSHISRTKALAARDIALSDDVIITADTMVFLDDQRLGKPRDEAEALQMLTALSGRSHTVCTGVTVVQGDHILTRAQSTAVHFREASQAELLGYIRSGEPMDKAGSYAVQGLGALLVKGIEGDFFNVMGLPLLLLSEMLQQFGFTFLA